MHKYNHTSISPPPSRWVAGCFCAVLLRFGVELVFFLPFLVLPVSGFRIQLQPSAAKVIDCRFELARQAPSAAVAYGTLE